MNFQPIEHSLERAEAFVAESYLRIERFCRSRQEMMDGYRIDRVARYVLGLQEGFIGDPDNPNPNGFIGTVERDDNRISLFCTEPQFYYGSRAYAKTDLTVVFDESLRKAVSIAASRQFHTPYHDIGRKQTVETSRYSVLHGRELLPSIAKTVRLARQNQAR